MSETTETKELAEDAKAAKKAKRRRRAKKVWRVIGIVFGVLILAGGIFLLANLSFLKAVLRMQKGDERLSQGTTDFEYVERHLTKEQMLEDFDYLYTVLCKTSFATEETERVFGVDYDEIYKRYRTRVENCKDEYEFEAIMVAFMAKLPGKHLSISPSTNNLNGYNGLTFHGFAETAYDDVMETNYSFWVQNKERMLSYDQRFALAVYYDGDYVLADNDIGTGVVDEIVGARILSIDGESPKTKIKDLDFYIHWDYDTEYDCLFTKNLYFNDGVGEKYAVEIEYPDGKTEVRDLYISAEYNMMVLNRKKFYPDETAPKAENTANTEPKHCYSVLERPEKNLVVITIESCETGEADAAFADITEALENVNAENVIIDNRSNGGGDPDFVTKGVLKAVLQGKHGDIYYNKTPYNDLTKTLFNNQVYFTKTGKWGTNSIEDCGDYARYGCDFTVDGQAKKKYNITVLTSHTTFSSGDILTALVKGLDNVTVIGENTKGEGLCGDPICHYLPNSKMVFVGLCGVSENEPMNNITGTEPDIHMANGWKEILAAHEITAKQGPDALQDFDTKLQVDKVMRYAYEH